MASKCPICFDTLPPTPTTTACDHTFCSPCLTRHVQTLSTSNPRYPFRCPCCPTALDNTFVLQLIADSPIHPLVEAHILRSAFHSRLRYCANPLCATPFDWLEDRTALGYRDEFKITCPLCTTATCVQCRRLWHEGRCEEEDITRLARERGWQNCPRCGALVEKAITDCFFVKCRCGCGFCHHCGSEYETERSSWWNLHGRPRCDCGILDWQEQVWGELEVWVKTMWEEEGRQLVRWAGETRVRRMETTVKGVVTRLRRWWRREVEAEVEVWEGVRRYAGRCAQWLRRDGLEGWVERLRAELRSGRSGLLRRWWIEIVLGRVLWVRGLRREMADSIDEFVDVSLRRTGGGSVDWRGRKARNCPM